MRFASSWHDNCLIEHRESFDKFPLPFKVSDFEIRLAYLAFSLDTDAPLAANAVLWRIVNLRAVCSIHRVLLQPREILLIYGTTIQLALGIV